jgi:hypothetical protein
MVDANGRIELEAKALTPGQIRFSVQDGQGGSMRGQIEVVSESQIEPPTGNTGGACQ